MSCITANPEETSCLFRLLVAGSGDREVRMLELAPGLEEVNDSTCGLPAKKDGCSGELRENTGPSTDQIHQQSCSEPYSPQSSDPPDLSPKEQHEENEAHDSCIEDSAIIKRPSLTSVDSGVVIDPEDLVSRPHTPAVEIAVLDKSSSPPIECGKPADEITLPLVSTQENIVSWTLTSHYDEYKPVSTTCPN